MRTVEVVGAACGLSVLLMTLTLETSMSDFVDLQRLSDEDRRVRLKLPAGCVPSLTAVQSATPPLDRVQIVVESRQAAVPDAARPGARPPRRIR
jgi:hypothetical protein